MAVQNIDRSVQTSPEVFLKDLLKQQVRDILINGMEDTEPQETILRVLREKYEGKRILKGMIDCLKVATRNRSVQVKYLNDLTTLIWRAHGKNEQLILAFTTSYVSIDTNKIENEYNPEFFGRLRARNSLREKALADDKLLDNLVDAVYKLKEARDLINRLTTAGEPLSAEAESIKGLIL